MVSGSGVLEEVPAQLMARAGGVQTGQDRCLGDSEVRLLKQGLLTWGEVKVGLGMRKSENQCC
jgi:hypothetical protein